MKDGLAAGRRVAHGPYLAEEREPKLGTLAQDNPLGVRQSLCRVAPAGCAVGQGEQEVEPLDKCLVALVLVHGVSRMEL